MKKTYMTPAMETVKLDVESMVCNSLTFSTEAVTSMDSKDRYDFDDDDDDLGSIIPW